MTPRKTPKAAPVEVTSKRRFDLDSWLAASGVREYEVNIMGTLYKVAPEVPLGFWLDMNERAAGNDGGYTMADCTAYITHSLGAGKYDELLAAGMGIRTRDGLVSALIAIHNGVELGEPATDGDQAKGEA